jgi:uncharacterized membrane protein required for colicin V production
MNRIDIVMLSILGIFVIYGFLSGLVRTVIILVGFVIGGIVGYYMPRAMGINYPLNFILGVLLFIVFWIIFGVIAHFVGKIGKIVPFNRLLGGILGLALGILFSLLIFTYLHNNVPEIKSMMEDSFSGKLLIYLKEILKRS